MGVVSLACLPFHPCEQQKKGIFTGIKVVLLTALSINRTLHCCAIICAIMNVQIKLGDCQCVTWDLIPICLQPSEPSKYST